MTLGPLFAAAVSACAAGRVEPPVELRFEHGPVLVIESRHALYIPHTVVVVADAARKALAKGLLEAAFPDEMGWDGAHSNGDGTVSFRIGTKALDLEIKTVDEYLAGQAAAEAANGRRTDESVAKARLASDLGSYFAVVYRYALPNAPPRPRPGRKH